MEATRKEQTWIDDLRAVLKRKPRSLQMEQDSLEPHTMSVWKWESVSNTWIEIGSMRIPKP